ncbi:MAG: GNAT superfamily N-acetyltransferase [Planctomycetota bacterium]|jgi:GNAT superfamily N-acetyltransferase
MEAPQEAKSHHQIRPATEGDVRILVEFQLAMARETEGKELDSALLEKGVRAVFADATRGRYLLACPPGGGAPLGSLMVTYEWSDWRAATFWWIQSVFVLSEARGQGVFQSLYDHLLAEAEGEIGVCGLRLYVDEGNASAQEVYRRVGMEESHYRFFELDFVLGDAGPTTGC